jgi:hypothetical protein
MGPKERRTKEGEQRRSLKAPKDQQEMSATNHLQPIVVEILGPHAARALGHLSTGPAAIWRLSRALLDSGFNPQTPLVTHDGQPVPATIGEGAGQKAVSWPPEAPPMRPSAEGTTQVTPAAKATGASL